MRSIPRDLPAAAKYNTLCALFLYAHADGGGIWVSITELAEDTGEPIRNVKRALKLLIERGYLTHEGWKTVGTNSTVRQRKIDLDALARDRAKEAWANGGTSANFGKALGPSVVSASATSGTQTIQNSPFELATKNLARNPPKQTSWRVNHRRPQNHQPRSGNRSQTPRQALRNGIGGTRGRGLRTMRGKPTPRRSRRVQLPRFSCRRSRRKSGLTIRSSSRTRRAG